MSLISIGTTVSGIILSSAINAILSALRLQFVGRNSSGDPASGQDLGTITYPWGAAHIGSLNIGGKVIDTSNIESPANRVISGAVRTNSEQPQFLDITGLNDEITVLGTATNLELSINTVAVSVAADILFQSLTTAPAANNTCLVDDSSLTDQLSSKYQGEDNSILTIGTVGSEITDRVGEMIALKKNGGSEIMFAYVKSITELSNIYRGFFYGGSDAPIVRETLADTDQLDIMSLGWIFIENTGTGGEIAYTTPVCSFTEPTAPVTGDYWKDLNTDIWMRFDSADFVQINRTLVGLVVVDGTNAIGYRPLDFFHDYRDTNTIELEIFSDEIIRSKDKTNNVYVYSKTLRIDNTKIKWNNTTDMETGSVAADTIYYLYEASTGEEKISLEKYYTRNDLRGKYHPYEAWRYIGKATTDSTSDWLNSQGRFTGLESVVYRLRVNVANDDDPLGQGGGEWEVADETENEFYLGNSENSLVSESNGVFSFQQTGYYIALLVAHLDDPTAASYGSLDIESSINNGSSYSIISAIESAVEYNGAGGGLNDVSVSGQVLIRVKDTPTDNKIKLAFATNQVTTRVVGSSTRNNTSLMFIKLADI